jgi:hypothetical protein
MLRSSRSPPRVRCSTASCLRSGLVRRTSALTASSRAGVRYRRARRGLLLVGVSMFDTLEWALQIDRRRPTWVAELRLVAGHGVHMAVTGSQGHRTVWGAPDDLAACVRAFRVAPWIAMTFATLYIDEGNLLDFHDDRPAARASVLSVVEEHPEVAEHFGMVELDGDGHRVGDFISGAEIMAAAARSRPSRAA